MNERIQQLEKQCWETRQLTDDAHSWHTSFNTQKFAELIVKECMTLCKTSVGNADYNTGRLHCLNNIKEHFGVLE